MRKLLSVVALLSLPTALLAQNGLAVGGAVNSSQVTGLPAAVTTNAPVQNVAGKTGSVNLTHNDIGDWAAATSSFSGGGSGTYQATETGSVATTVPIKLEETLSVTADFGAKGDAQVVTNGAMTSGTKTLTSASGLFSSGDVGKSVGVVGAGAAGIPLVTTISAYTSATQVTLTAAASTTVSAAYVSWGTDDTTAIQNALTNGARKPIRFPNTGKRYLVGALTVPSNTQIVFMPGATLQIKSGLTTNQVVFGMTAVSNVRIIGDGAYIYAPFAEYTSEYNHIFALYAASNVSIQGITIDGSGGDGIYVADNGGSTYSQNVVIDHITTNHVHRNGISVISAKHLIVSNSTFSNDCCDGNDPSYNNPGIDIEPNGPSNVLQDISFHNNYTFGNKGSGLNFTLSNLSNATLPVSIRVNGLWSEGDGFGSVSTQCGTASVIPGKIDMQDVRSNNSNSFGMNLLNWTTACPVMTIKNPTVINPNVGVAAQEAIAVYQGGGGTFKYGNIDLEDAVIVDNRGTSKTTWYLQIADYSNLGVSNFHFTPKYLSGAIHGTATEGAQYSIEEPYQQTTATPVFDASNGDPSAYFHVTLNKNVTSSTLINTVPGQLLTFEICSSGSFTFAWPSNVYGGLAAPTSGNCIVQHLRVSTDGVTARAVNASGGGSSGVSSVNGQTGTVVLHKTCEIHIWGDGASGALQTSDSEKNSCYNDSGAALTVTAVHCLADNSSTTTKVTPILTGGAATSLLTAALTCGSGTFTAGTLNGTPTLAAGGTIDANITAAGTANSLRVVVSF